MGPWPLALIRYRPFLKSKGQFAVMVWGLRKVVHDCILLGVFISGLAVVS